ncbi:MAG: response regulator [Burkholderiaceae bacterium]
MKNLLAPAAILVASDNPSHAALAREAIASEYENVQVSLDRGVGVVDFERYSPTVLILAFDTLAKSERHYLSIWRHSVGIRARPHRAIVLCKNTEVRRAYELCKEELFDSYVPFWPMTMDPKGLAMAVHTALREMALIDREGPSLAEWAAQARKLDGLDALFEQRMRQGREEIDQLGQSVEQAEERVGVALDGLAKQISRPQESNVPDSQVVEGLQRELARIRREAIVAPFDAATRAVAPLRQWVKEFREDSQRGLESSRSLQVMAKQVRPTILVVDDDEFQHKAIANILSEKEFRLIFATNGIESLSVLRELRPDMILMDMMMPGIDGAETTRRIKASGRFAHIPVVMMTGTSKEAVISEGIKAGAIDFVVKPFDRTTLIDRVMRALQSLE